MKEPQFYFYSGYVNMVNMVVVVMLTGVMIILFGFLMQSFSSTLPQNPINRTLTLN